MWPKYQQSSHLQAQDEVTQLKVLVQAAVQLAPRPEGVEQEEHPEKAPRSQGEDDGPLEPVRCAALQAGAPGALPSTNDCYFDGITSPGNGVRKRHGPCAQSGLTHLQAPMFSICTLQKAVQAAVS